MYGRVYRRCWPPTERSSTTAARLAVPPPPQTALPPCVRRDTCRAETRVPCLGGTVRTAVHGVFP